jgi:hypothetical protein
MVVSYIVRSEETGEKNRPAESHKQTFSQQINIAMGWNQTDNFCGNDCISKDNPHL